MLLNFFPTRTMNTLSLPMSWRRLARAAGLFLSLMLLAAGAQSLPAAELDDAVNEALKYESGRSAEPLRQIEQAVRDAVANRSRRARVEAALLRLLAPEATFEARRFACVQLANLGTDASLNVLSGLLQDPQTTGMACLALGTHPSAKANDLLLKALASAAPEARAQIIVTLGDRRAAVAVKSLVPFTRDPDRGVREAAIGALGKIASPPAFDALAALRQDSDAEIRRLAVLASLVGADHALNNRGAKVAQPIYEELLAQQQPPYVRRAALEGLLRLDADGGERRALEVLSGADTVLRPSALVRVRAMPGRGVSARFAAELPRLATAEQVLLLDSLAERGDADALKAIQDATQAPAAAVRHAAVTALARVGDATAVPVLAKALVNFPTAAEQQTVEMALASLPGGEAVDKALLQALQNSAPAALPGLMNAAGRRGVKAAAPLLLANAPSENPAMARAAFRALGRVAGPAEAAAMLDTLGKLKASAARGDAETAAIKILEREPDAARRTALVTQALRQAGDVAGRCSLITLLPVCGDAASLKALQAERAAADPAVRDAALRALMEWPDPAAAGLLLTEAQNAAQNTERVLALRGAVRLLSQTANTAPALAAAQFQKAMQLARTDGEKKLVISGLAGLHHEQALRLLEPHLDDAAVRAEAEQAAMNLAPRLAGAHPETVRAVLKKLAASPSSGKAAAELLDVMGRFGDFLLAWQVAGPFTAEGKDGQALFDVVFPPEQPDGAARTAWQLAPVGTRADRPWQVDLARLFSGDNRAAYARVWVYSETAQPARLELGADDGIKAWVNGRVVLAANRGGDVTPASFKADVALQAGWNTVMLKITQWTSGWGFCARLARPDGTALPGLRLSPHPPNAN